MPDQEFNKIYPLPGFEFPAVRKTIQHFLSLSQKTPLNRQDLVAAIELDPSLLAAFLANGNNPVLSNWHLDLDQQQLKHIALTLSNQFAAQEVSESAKRYFFAQWRRSLLHSNLCSELAKLLSEDVTLYRLLGLMAGLGHHVFAKTYNESYFTLLNENTSPALLISAEQDKFGLGGDELGANLFKSWGYPANHVDTLRFQYADLNELQDASQMVKIVAYARRLLELVRYTGIPDPELVSAGTKLFGINESAINTLVTKADQTFSITQEQLFSDDNSANLFKSNLANANIAAAIETSACLGEQSISRTGNLVFGINASFFFHITGDQLQTTLADSEVLSVEKISKRSQLALSYQQDTTITAEGETLNSIVDKQILDRLQATTLWFLPLGKDIGVLVCGLNQQQKTAPPLLDSFQLAASKQFRLMRQNQVPLFDAEFFRKRVGEVTHEVNNPLTIVQNYLRTLSIKLGEDSPAQTDIETISQELMRVGSIVKKYSEIGRQEVLTAQKINVNNMLSSLVSVFRGSYETVNFDIKLDKAMPLVVITPDSFKQVIVNIVKNAVEVLHDSSDAEVIISSHGSINLGGQQYIEVQVSDNGSGIPLPIRNKLFQPDNSNKGEGHSGLGLSIVKQLVTQMDGLISCKSQVAGEGTTGTIFQILIPSINTQA